MQVPSGNHLRVILKRRLFSRAFPSTFRTRVPCCPGIPHLYFLYPLFLLSKTAWIKEAQINIRRFLVGIVVLNLVVLFWIFILPRARFVISHIALDSGLLMETAGSPDMPNQFSKTYEVVNQIQGLTSKGSTLFLPSGLGPGRLFRSAAIQRLYPRKLYFADDAEFKKELKSAEGKPETYFVSHQTWHPKVCLRDKEAKLIGLGFSFCRLGAVRK